MTLGLAASLTACLTGETDLGHTDASVGHCGTGTGSIDLQNDATNCGACGVQCGQGQVCSHGQCTTHDTPCTAGYADCNADAADGCEVNTVIDSSNCGRCGVRCSGQTCTAGTCNDTPLTCTTGFADCDGNPSNGCEVSTGADASNCGACGNRCAAGQVCAQSVCKPVQSDCAVGLADCNNNPADGCEVNVTSDASNCGNCGIMCSTPHGISACVNGACVTALCSSGFGDCDRDPSNGCETDLGTDSNNCGACEKVCTNAHGTSACANGSCTPVCSAGSANCDADPLNGCEIDTTVDVNHCGSCTRVCVAPNATSVCTGGACAIGVCNVGYADCNAIATDGCEVNLRTDANDCGICGAVCSLAHAVGACTNGSCGISACEYGYEDCDNNPANGCEVSIATDPCNNCGQPCSFANGVGSCATGFCRLATCNTGYSDCDADLRNGCETQLASSDANCGACAVACAPGKHCSNGACV